MLHAGDRDAETETKSKDAHKDQWQGKKRPTQMHSLIYSFNKHSVPSRHQALSLALRTTLKTMHDPPLVLTELAL